MLETGTTSYCDSIQLHTNDDIADAGKDDAADVLQSV
jgi:hypothetical protein